MFEGVNTALITPFRDGTIDYDVLEVLIERQIEGGVDGIVPMGTTGESPTVSHPDHREFIRRVVELVDGRVKVLAGTGSNSTEEAISLSRAAADAGVDGLLLVNPYYNKPPQEGLILHFDRVARSVPVPSILYNIPGRTGVNFQPENVARLLDNNDQIVAMKEASGDIAQIMRLYELCGDRLTILSGDDNMFFPLLSVGGKGIISVISNIIPSDMKKVHSTFMSGNLDEARNIFYRLLPLARMMFLDTNPIPVKAAMEMMGLCGGELRLPLVPLPGDKRALLREALTDYGLL
jgi:4-hydroxy-tetrahydrodipicolinate synthase